MRFALTSLREDFEDFEDFEVSEDEPKTLLVPAPPVLKLRAEHAFASATIASNDVSPRPRPAPTLFSRELIRPSRHRAETSLAFSDADPSSVSLRAVPFPSRPRPFAVHRAPSPSAFAPASPVARSRRIVVARPSSSSSSSSRRASRVASRAGGRSTSSSDARASACAASRVDRDRVAVKSHPTWRHVARGSFEIDPSRDAIDRSIAASQRGVVEASSKRRATRRALDRRRCRAPRARRPRVASSPTRRRRRADVDDGARARMMFVDARATARARARRRTRADSRRSSRASRRSSSIAR